MEILLLQDVTGVGKKNDLLVVGDGYALNYLLPHRKALVATPTVRKRYADQIRKRAEEKEQERALRANAAAALSGKSVTFTKKMTKTGLVFLCSHFFNHPVKFMKRLPCFCSYLVFMAEMAQYLIQIFTGSLSVCLQNL